MKIFKIGYTYGGTDCSLDYIIARDEEHIKEILSKRVVRRKEEIELTYYREVSIEAVSIRNLTLGDFIRLEELKNEI